MEHFNGVDSEVFKDQDDSAAFDEMLDKAKKENQQGEDKGLLRKLFDELKEKFN